MIGLFRALWFLRRDTFTRKGERGTRKDRFIIGLANLVILLLVMMLSVFPALFFFLMYSTIGNILGICVMVSFTAFTVFFYQAPFFKALSDESYSTRSDYMYRLNSLSAIYRLNKYFAVLGLELKFCESTISKPRSDSFHNPFTMGELKLCNKGTLTVPQGLKVENKSYLDYSCLVISEIAIKQKKVKQTSFMEEDTWYSKINQKGTPDDPKISRAYNLNQAFMNSNFNRYLFFRAFTFWLAKFYLKKDISNYGTLWFQARSIKPIWAALKLEIEPEKLIELVWFKVEVKDYADVKDIPLSWLEKTYGKQLITA